jgi:hypothetical protein
MTLLNPAMLLGLLAVGLPVAIHLLSRPRLRRIAWAAGRLLLKSVQQTRRRTQVEDKLLLALRCLLVAVLALLFARPAFLTDATTAAFGGEASTAIILLDDSESMGQSDGEQIRFEQAKAMAGDVLDKLGAGSTCALDLVDDSIREVIPKPTENLAIVRRFLEQAKLTDRGTDLYPGLKEAIDRLKVTPGPHKKIFLFTDSQMPAWQELARIRQLQQDIAKDIEIYFIVVGREGEDNVAVSGLQTLGAVAAVGEPVRCSVRVTNWGHATVEKIPVKLAIDGEAPQDEGLIDRIEPGQTQAISLFVHFRNAGPHSITASIPGDRLPADNQRSRALDVVDRIKALVVEGTTSADPASQDGFFLSHALVPVAPELVDSYYLQATTGRPSNLESPALNSYGLIFLSNVAQLSDPQAQNLAAYVKNGGALVVFPGPATSVNFYDNSPAFSPLLPATLAPAQGPPDGHPFLAWQGGDYPHPITALWNEPSSGTLGSVRVSRYFPLKTKSGPDAHASPVVSYADGEPAVVEQAVGKGRVFLFSSTATTAWTTLPIHPGFVPLLLRLVSYATTTAAPSLNLSPGQTFIMDVDSTNAGREVSVLSTGEKERHGAGSIEVGEHATQLRYSDTDRAGTYTLFLGDDKKPIAVFAIQADPAESNLRQEPAADLQPLLAATQPAPGGESDGAPAKKAALRVPGAEIWLPLAVAAGLLALLDTALAHRFSQPK